MTYNELVEDLPVWNKFLNIEVTAHCAKQVIAVHESLMGELNFIAQEKKTILEKYAGRIENDRIIIDNKDDVEKYNKDIDALMNSVINVNPIQIKSTDIGSKFSPALAIALKDLVILI